MMAAGIYINGEAYALIWYYAKNLTL